jgi:hypothetical protein
LQNICPRSIFSSSLDITIRQISKTKCLYAGAVCPLLSPTMYTNYQQDSLPGSPQDVASQYVFAVHPVSTKIFVLHTSLSDIVVT